ncbi:MAG: helix-turn-helix domain-containing protein [Pseudomonadota bacterium]
MNKPETLSAFGSIGQRIRLARKEAGLSQAELARRIGVSQPAIATWESGVHDPRKVVLAKLADALSTPLEWLAAGARSPIETDRHPAAAYLRRPLTHVPVINMRDAARIGAGDGGDPHKLAEDYIPVTAGGTRLFALFLNDPAVDRAFPAGSLVVIDYEDQNPADGAFCLATHKGIGLVRRMNTQLHQLEAFSTQPSSGGLVLNPDVRIIGCARLSIRFH